MAGSPASLKSRLPRRKTLLDVPPLYRLHPRAVWRFVQRQPLSFWLVNFYMFMEYVRPQQVWPVLDVLPWGITSLVAATLAVALEGRLTWPRSVAGATLLLYSVILVLSSVMAVDPAASYARWELYFSWVLVFVLIVSTMNTERRVFVFMFAFMLYCFKMSQFGFRSWVMNGFGFSDWGVTGGHAWFANSGEFGIQMCMFLPLSVEFILALREHWKPWVRWLMYSFPVTAVGSIVASSSRGALLGAAAVGLWWVARSRHRVRTLLVAAVLASLTWAVTPAEQKARFSTAGEDDTSVSRLERWEAGIDMANEYPVFGIGYNNWLTYYGPLSHNIFIEAWSELGYSGLIAFLLLIAATFRVNSQTRKLLRNVPLPSRLLTHLAYGLDGALVGFLVSGFFVTVLYYPFFWINLAMTAAVHGAARKERRRWIASGHAFGVGHSLPATHEPRPMAADATP